MGAINKILVAVDGSDNACKAVDRAIDLAAKAKASIDFVYVASHINEHIPSEIVFNRIWEKLPESVTARKHVETGSRSKAILKVAQETNTDMIVMGSRGLSIFRGALIGSISQKVIENSTVPVMVVK